MILEMDGNLLKLKIRGDWSLLEETENLEFRVFLRLEENEKLKPKSQWAKGGIKMTATMMDANSAKVLVNAKGRNSFPSAATIVKTGKKLMMVVATAVMTAEATSVVAR